jgi:hypothetical protein
MATPTNEPPLAAGIVAIAAIAAPANAGTVSGTVYIDRDGSGSLSPGDTAAEGIAVFWETERFAVTVCSVVRRPPAPCRLN